MPPPKLYPETLTGRHPQGTKAMIRRYWGKKYSEFVRLAVAEKLAGCTITAEELRRGKGRKR